MTKTRTQLAIVFASAAAVLAAVMTVAPRTTLVTNEVSGEVLGIDILGLTKHATKLPEQQYAVQ
jgi:hypothetical protein